MTQVATSQPWPRLMNADQTVAWAQRLVEDLTRRYTELASTVNSGSGSGAPTTSDYVLYPAIDATLTNARLLFAGSGISLTDGGAGGHVTIAATGSAPTGSAGGDLTGTYPNPTLATAGPGATGPIGAATTVPIVTIDAKGRVTALSSTTITGTVPGGSAGGDLTGTYPNPTLATAGPGATGPIGAATTVPIVTIDAKGRVTGLTSTTITGTVPGGAAGGDLTGTYPNPTLAAAGPGATGPLGSATVAPIVTIDAKGRVTALSSATVTPAVGSITGLATGMGAWLVSGTSADLATAVTNETGSGALVFGTSPTFTTDIRTPIVYGGTGSGGGISIQSTTNATRGTISAVDELQLRTGTTSITTGFLGGNATTYYWSRANFALSFTDSLNTISVLAATGTITDGGANLLYLYNNTMTVDRTSGGAFSQVSVLNNTPTYRANGAAITSGSVTGFLHGPTYNTTGGGTIAGVSEIAIGCGLTVTAGTIDTRRCLVVNDAAGAGSVTNQIAIDIAALAKGGTLNIGMRSAITAASTNYFLRDTGGAQSSLVGKFTTYNNVSTVEGGLTALYAEINATAQGADIASATLYAVPSAGAGLYRVSVYIQVTRAGTTSTMPAVRIGWTDQDASTAFTNQQITASSAGNTTSTFAQGTFTVNAKASTNITYNTNGWASTGGTSMQFALRIRVEAI